MADQHIYHATAVLAELGLAMSIATITKIIAPPKETDLLARETTRIRIAEHDGWTAAAFYTFGCWVSSIMRAFVSFIPHIVFVLECLVLGGMAFSPPTALVAGLLFGVSFLGLIMIILYVYFNRETFRKTEEKPIIEPAD